MDVFQQRLEQEYGAHVLVTTPTVPFIVEFIDGSKRSLENPCDFPLGIKLASVKEPTVLATIITPSEYVGGIMELCQGRRGDMQEHSYVGGER